VNPQRDDFRNPHGRVASLRPRGGASDLYNARFFCEETPNRALAQEPTAQPVEIVAPQIQITGRKTEKKKKKEGKGVISDQLEIRGYKLSVTRLEAGGRADGVVVFDRPNFKQSTGKLFLQIAQADQVDRPILIRLPFTPPSRQNANREDRAEYERP
jgi:hypothetical protein